MTFSHFHHDTRARSFAEAIVRYGDRRNVRWSIGTMKSLSILIGWYWMRSEIA
jgi:hypothetical protein